MHVSKLESIGETDEAAKKVKRIKRLDGCAGCACAVLGALPPQVAVLAPDGPLGKSLAEHGSAPALFLT